MSRKFVINGECFVQVKGNGAIAELAKNPPDPLVGSLQDLGLTTESVTIIPRFSHYAVKADDFGPDVPAEILWNLAEVRISMTLVHYDDFVLDAVIAESMCGGVGDGPIGVVGWAGQMMPAGTPMGGNKPLYTSGNHYIGLNISSPILGFPWRFPATYLASQPVVIPLGTRRSEVQLNWRAIPYQFYSGDNKTQPLVEIVSSGVELWTRKADR